MGRVDVGNGPTSITGASPGIRVWWLGGYVPVATVNPESIRELYRESFRTRAQVQRGSMGRARCGTIACGLNVGDVSNVCYVCGLRVI